MHLRANVRQTSASVWWTSLSELLTDDNFIIMAVRCGVVLQRVLKIKNIRNQAPFFSEFPEESLE